MHKKTTREDTGYEQCTLFMPSLYRKGNILRKLRGVCGWSDVTGLQSGTTGLLVSLVNAKGSHHTYLILKHKVYFTFVKLRHKTVSFWSSLLKNPTRFHGNVDVEGTFR